MCRNNSTAAIDIASHRNSLSYMTCKHYYPSPGPIITFMESLIELSMEILDAVTELYNKSLKAGDVPQD